METYLAKQYKETKKSKINHSYLIEQFSDYLKIFKKIEKVVKKGDYTLGAEVDICEKNFAKRAGGKFAISVGNGTDALYLSLKALDIGIGDEVLLSPYSFIATCASIHNAGAKPVFVDIKNDYNIDENKIENAITKKTKAIMPVHWAGRPCEMTKISRIAKKHKLKIIQDTSHGIDARYKNKHLINFGDICTYSMHPLKNLNVWGDGGFIVTNNEKLAKKISLLRNHGLINRNRCKFFGYNSRLDSIQAAIANYKMKNKLNNITKRRIKNANLFDKYLGNISQVETIKREKHLIEVFHLYQVNIRRKRNELIKYLNKNNVDAKVHYPIPMHLQEAAKYLNYTKGSFPMAEKLSNISISLPVHEFIKMSDIKYVAELIKKFYEKN